MALTDTKLRNAKAKDKSYKVYDEKGLFIQIQPNGNKLWRFKYKFDGKEKLIGFKSYPDVSLSEARAMRDDARKLLAKDIDPSEARKTAQIEKEAASKHSFEAVAREWLSVRMKGRNDKYQNNIIRRFELYIFPYLGNKLIKEITPPELLKSLRRIEEKGTFETAHRTLRAAGQVFRYAIATGVAERDITQDLKGALTPHTPTHMPAFTEPDDVAGLLRAIDGFSGTLTVKAALQLSPLVFLRPGEIRQAKWSEIDLESGVWSFNASKTNTPHIVPLSRQALEILNELHPLSGHGEYVFQGRRDQRKPMSTAAINAALQRMGIDTKTEMTGHGFRATARTILRERLGVNGEYIERQLAHKTKEANGEAYDRAKFLPQRKDMMQVWADYLDEIKAGAKVLPFKQA